MRAIYQQLANSIEPNPLRAPTPPTRMRYKSHGLCIGLSIIAAKTRARRTEDDPSLAATRRDTREHAQNSVHAREKSEHEGRRETGEPANRSRTSGVCKTR